MMDKLQELFKNNKFNDILNETKGKKDYLSLVYRINAFINLKDNKSALKVINNNLDTLYNKDPLKTMSIHFELLLELKDYEEAYKTLKMYNEKPYISQKVEEFLRDIPNRITSKEQLSAIEDIFNDEDKVNELFRKEKDNTLLLNAIYSLKKFDIEPYLDSLIYLLTRKDIADETKTMAFFVLITKKINQEVNIFIKGKNYTSNPSKVTPPFADKHFLEVKNKIMKLSSKDPSLEEVAINLFNQYVFNTFLDDTYNESLDFISIIFVALAMKYMQNSEDEIKRFIINNALDPIKAKSFMDLYLDKINKK